MDDNAEPEVWVVRNAEGADFVATYRDAAMEHAAMMAGDHPDLGPWRVSRYVLAATPTDTPEQPK